MVKLSQQLRGVSSQRPTRTERVLRKQSFQREKKSFDNLRQEAKEKQKDFEDLKSIDEYEHKYNLLRPELRQFFNTPETLRIQQTERIGINKQRVEEKIKSSSEQLIKAKVNYDEKLRKLNEWFNRRTDKDKHRERYEKKKWNLEDDFEEKRAYLLGYQKGFGKGLDELNKGKDVSFSNIENHALNLGNFQERKEEASNVQNQQEQQQQQEIAQLVEQGFKPQIIEQSFKGDPESVVLSFYNPQTQDWKSVAKYDVKGEVAVSGLKKVGYSAPQERALEFAGKTYGFQSRIGIYKTPKGEIVTPYEKTGITEQQLIKEQQDIAFKDFQKEQKPSHIPIKILTPKDLPIGYGGQQTVSTTPKTFLIDEDLYYKQKDRKISDLGVGKLLGYSGKAFKFVDERVHFKLGATPVVWGKFEKPTDYEKSSIELESGLEMSKENLRKWAIDNKKVDDLSENLENKYTQQYQKSFENKYIKSLIYGETTFKKASTEFAESEEAKRIQRRYTEEYGQSYKEIDQSTSLGKKLGGGAGITFLSAGQLLFKASRSPTRVVATTVGVYGGVKALSLIPHVASYGLSGGLFAYGTYKAFSPTSTIEEAGGGLITAIISGATLGYGAYRHLKTPVIKVRKIPSPKMKLKSAGTVGQDITLIKGHTKTNIVLYEKQKLSQFGVAGRRTIVTTKGKLLSKSFFEKISGKKIALDDFSIYSGVPTKQLAKTIKIPKLLGVKGSGKSFIKLTYKQSGYTKAIKSLKSYGWTDAQAKATLRYVAPQVYDQSLERGLLTIKGSKAVGEFTHLTQRPVITVDKKLGIKTRGGKTIRDITDIEREIINLNGKKLILEDQTSITIFVKGKRLYRFKDFASTRGFSVGDVSKTYKEFGVVGKDKGLTVLKPSTPFKELQTISATRQTFPSSKTINVGYQDTRLYKKIVDISKKSAFIKPTTKPFNVNKDVNKAITDIVGKTQSKSNLKYLINKLDDVGVIGKTQTTKQLQTQLMSTTPPPAIKVTPLKNLIKVKGLSKLIGLQTGQLASTTALGLKSDLKLKTSLKVDTALKNLLKEDTVLKIKQIPALKSSTALKSQLKSILDLELVSPIATPSPTTTYRPPRIPQITPLKPIPFAIMFPTVKSSGKWKGRKKSFNELAYLPDFTSRALGLRSETITEKQALTKMKKILTGLEIRRGIRLR